MTTKPTHSAFGKYYFYCTLIMLSYGIAVIPLAVYLPLWLAVSVLILLYIPVKYLVRIAAHKTIVAVLYRDLDAYEFQKILRESKHFIAPPAYRINAALDTGDYQTAVNIAAAIIRKYPRSLKTKYYALSVLAWVYFHVGDREKLTTLLDEHEKLITQYPKKKFLTMPNSAWSYYRYFLEQNYEACKTVCRERNLRLKPSSWEYKFARLQNDSLWAIACYQNGELDAAKAVLERISLDAPKMYGATIAEKYLDAIEQGVDPVICDREILPDDGASLYDPQTASRQKRFKVIMVVYFVLCIILLAIHLLPSSADESDLFEIKLNDAVSEAYENAEWLDYFNVRKDEEWVDSICIVQNGDQLDLTEVISSNEGETLDLAMVVENIQPDRYYCVKPPYGENYIGFVLSTQPPSGQNLYHVRAFEHGGRTYWLLVDYIETTPQKNGSTQVALEAVLAFR